MLDTSVNFLKIYKKLDQLIKDTLQTTEGVTEYINMLAQLSFTGELEQLRKADYRGLKHIRWIRNKLVHEPDTLESGLCTTDDVRYTTEFYNRLMQGQDCLSVVAQQTNVTAQSGGAFGNSQSNDHPTAKRPLDTGRSTDGLSFKPPVINNTSFGNGQNQQQNNAFGNQVGGQSFGNQGGNANLGSQSNNAFNGQPKYQNAINQNANNQGGGQNQPFGSQYGSQQYGSQQFGTQRQGDSQPFGNNQSQQQGNNQPFGGSGYSNNQPFANQSNPFAQKPVANVNAQQSASNPQIASGKNPFAGAKQPNGKMGSQPFVAKPVAVEQPITPQPQQENNWQQPTIKRAPVVTAEEANPDEDRPKSVFAKLVDKIKKLFS